MYFEWYGVSSLSTGPAAMHLSTCKFYVHASCPRHAISCLCQQLPVVPGRSSMVPGLKTPPICDQKSWKLLLVVSRRSSEERGRQAWPLPPRGKDCRLLSNCCHYLELQSLVHSSVIHQECSDTFDWLKMFWRPHNVSRGQWGVVRGLPGPQEGPGGQVVVATVSQRQWGPPPHSTSPAPRNSPPPQWS